LDAIFHAPNYHFLRVAIGLIRDGLTDATQKILTGLAPESTARIVQHLMTSVLYNTITNYADWEFDTELSNDAATVIPPTVGYNLNILITHCVKGKSVQFICNSILNSCAKLLVGLSELNNMDYLINDDGIVKLHAYNFGSTCRTYAGFATDMPYVVNTTTQNPHGILKVYDSVPRWTSAGHVTAEEIFENEARIMEKLHEYTRHYNTPAANGIVSAPIINYQLRHILMPYAGRSLYDCPSILPENWVTQITRLFADLSNAGIYYPEFNLTNICVSDAGQMSFIDFGLAKLVNPVESSSINSLKINDANCNTFIALLSELMPRLQTETNLDEQHRLYQAFIRNKKTIQDSVGANRNIY